MGLTLFVGKHLFRDTDTLILGTWKFLTTYHILNRYHMSDEVWNIVRFGKHKDNLKPYHFYKLSQKRLQQIACTGIKSYERNYP